MKRRTRSKEMKLEEKKQRLALKPDISEKITSTNTSSSDKIISISGCVQHLKIFKDVLISYEMLTLGELIGQGTLVSCILRLYKLIMLIHYGQAGAFGKVFTGECKIYNDIQRVAVKTLKSE